jgi:hypothetical protein
MQSLSVAMRDLLDADSVRTPTASQLQDSTETRGIAARADALVMPRSAVGVARVLAWCNEREVPVTARGGGDGPGRRRRAVRGRRRAEPRADDARARARAAALADVRRGRPEQSAELLPRALVQDKRRVRPRSQTAHTVGSHPAASWSAHSWASFLAALYSSIVCDTERGLELVAKLIRGTAAANRARAN